MRLDTLKHIAASVLTMSEAERLVVFGSTSLLPSFPEVGSDHGGPLAKTFDVDLIPYPFVDELGIMLHDTFGKDRPFHTHFGYYADIIRPIVTEQFPEGWQTRLVPLPGVPNAFCLEPHDMAAAKCQAGRPKDIELLSYLFRTNRLDPEVAKQRLTQVAMREAMIVKAHRVLRQSVEASCQQDDGEQAMD